MKMNKRSFESTVCGGNTMNISGKKFKRLELGALIAALTLGSGVASAADYYLCAGTTSKTMADGTVVTMWGYAQDDNNNLLDGCGANPVTVPGPALTVAPGDTELTVNLRNDLAVPTSMVINGQQTGSLGIASAPAPVFFTDGQARQRMRSLAPETGTGGIGTYSWTNIQPGTYLYESGTHQAVQVQMGLYGAMTKDNATGEAYPGIAYDNEVTMLYSEVDPVMNAAINGAPISAVTGLTDLGGSTVLYDAKYFLINGKSYEAGDPTLANVSIGDTTLLRMLNAGLETHSPTMQSHMTIVAEDGNVYPYQRHQLAVDLHAGKTQDVIITTNTAGTKSIIDSSMGMSNGSAGTGGMMAFIDVTAAAAAPVAADDSYPMIEDGSIVAAASVLGNDTGVSGTSTVQLASGPSVGSLTLNADGTFDYTPPADFSGSAQFDYIATEGGANSNAATVTIDVAAVDDDPVAVNDAYATNGDTTLNVAAAGVLANDGDADGDTITAALVSAATNGTVTLNADGSFSYVPNVGFIGQDSFTYTANDAAAPASNVATVTIDVNAAANIAPVAEDDFGITVLMNPVTIDLTANDSDIDGTVNTSSVVILVNPLRGTVTNNGDGTVTYTSNNFIPGSDAFGYQVLDNDGAVSNIGTVRVNIYRR